MNAPPIRRIPAAPAGSPPRPEPATATPRWRLDHRPRCGGEAFADRAFMEELRELHRRLGGDASTQASLEALAQGASCVVTGQQPALAVGPLFVLHKISGAIALAEEASRRSGRRVVPVFWCGADDSDFHEIRRAWLLGDDGAMRVELDRALHRPGGRVGSIPGAMVRPREEAALRAWWPSVAYPPLLDPLPEDLGLGERMAAWLLRFFAGRGLVVVDARSSRLLELGRPLFAAYAERHAAISAAVLDRDGPLAIESIQSGLFEIEGDRRRKIAPDALAETVHTAAEIAPGVLLRAVWQDALLAPAAAVLGPSEWRYHQQIAPVYALLGVEAAAPAPRPRLGVLPPGQPLPTRAEHWQRLLAGGTAAARWWEENTPAPAVDALFAERRRFDAQWWSRLEDAIGREPTARWRKIRRRYDQLVATMGTAARRRRLGPVFVDWMGLPGRPQERLYSAWMRVRWFPSGPAASLRPLEAAYLAALAAEQAPVFVQEAEH